MKHFLLNSNNISRDSFIWNMIGSTLMAFQSVIILMALTRVVDLEDAGIFTIAYTTANLLLSVGKYGMHNFQVSDTDNQFSFFEYRKSRIITTAIMLITAGVYIFIFAEKNNYSTEKSLCILWMCFYKAVDAIEDVYCSLYQQNGRLDVAGKAMSLRLFLSTIFFITYTVISKRLLPAIITTTLFTTVLTVCINIPCYSVFKSITEKEENKRQVFSLLVKCFPLFLGVFFSYYVQNAPKYAIDSMLGDELQACYGFIAMPIFVINLLGNYIFNTIIRPMSEKWHEGDLVWFKTRIYKQVLIIIGITVICLIGAAILGIPVLSWLYNTNLTNYKVEFLVLLSSGGFLALSGQLMNIATIMRKQNVILIGYGLCSILAFVFSPILLKQYSIMGAAILEVILMAILCTCFAIVLFRGIKRRSKELST